MAVETHWICDVCGNRKIDRGQTKNYNETKIGDWFVITLNVRQIDSGISGKQAYECGYACSKKCYEKIIKSLKDIAYKKMTQDIGEEK